MAITDEGTIYLLGVELMKAGVDVALVEPEDDPYAVYRFVRTGELEFQFYLIGHEETSFEITPEMLDAN